MSRMRNLLPNKSWLLPILAMLCLMTADMASAQKKKAANQKTTAVQSARYRNLFREAGYSQADYDGLMYLFGLMHLSGQYQIIQPQPH